MPLNNGEFALGQDDEGHIGGGDTEAWAVDDPVLKVDFAYLSEHVFALAAKAIIASYYGSARAHGNSSSLSSTVDATHPNLTAFYR